MNLRINAGINWSLSELKKLVNNKDSCVHFVKQKRHIALHPFHLNDLNKALHEILSSSINFYDPELKGLLLSYKNPKLLSSLGSILYDSHFIHVDIEADFYVFKPDIGNTLSGIVNKQAANHVGVLVHKVFNVSIPMNDNDVDWRGHTDVGVEVKFTVTHVDFKGRLPFIRGELLSRFSQKHCEKGQIKLNSLTDDCEIANSENLMHGYDISESRETSLKSKEHTNFLISMFNQTSESSSEDETKSLKKICVQRKEKKILEKCLEENRKKTKSTMKHKKRSASTSEDKNLDSEPDSDACSEKNGDTLETTGSTHCKSAKLKLIEKKQNTLDEKSIKDMMLPPSTVTVDKKPRIIHDRVLNVKQRNITIDKPSSKKSTRKCKFAQGVFDSDDDTDNQQEHMITTNNFDGNSETIFPNGTNNTNSLVINDGHQEISETSIRKKNINNAITENVGFPNENMNEKDDTQKKVTKLIPEGITLKKSSKYKITEESVNDPAGFKRSNKADDCDVSIGTFNNDDQLIAEKPIKKSKNLSPEKITNNTIVKRSLPSEKKLDDSVTNELGKSQKSNEKTFQNEDETNIFLTPKKIKTKKYEENLFKTIKIKREPDASDCEGSSDKKFTRKEKNNVESEKDSSEKVTVKHEPISVKSETKNKAAGVKRKYKEDSEMNLKVKCESDTLSNTDQMRVPKKKSRTIFSE